jgi:hypothetical protein
MVPSPGILQYCRVAIFKIFARRRHDGRQQVIVFDSREGQAVKRRLELRGGAKLRCEAGLIREALAQQPIIGKQVTKAGQ